MNKTGKEVIDAISRRLKDENIRVYDHAIVNKLSQLNRYEMSQLFTFGDIDKWVADRNKKTRAN